MSERGETENEGESQASGPIDAFAESPCDKIRSRQEANDDGDVLQMVWETVVLGALLRSPRRVRLALAGNRSEDGHKKHQHCHSKQRPVERHAVGEETD